MSKSIVFVLASLLLALFHAGCNRTETCDCFDDAESAHILIIKLHSFGRCDSIHFFESRYAKGAEKYFRLFVDYQGRKDSIQLYHWGLDKGDTILYAQFWSGDVLKKLEIYSDSFALNKQFTEFTIKGFREGRWGCKCFTATSKTCGYKDSTLNIMDGLFIKK